MHVDVRKDDLICYVILYVVIVIVVIVVMVIVIIVVMVIVAMVMAPCSDGGMIRLETLIELNFLDSSFSSSSSCRYETNNCGSGETD